MVFETKSSLSKFSPGRESSNVLMLKLGIFFKNSELELSSPRRLDKKSSFEVLWKGSSDSKHLGQDFSRTFYVGRPLAFYTIFVTSISCDFLITFRAFHFVVVRTWIAILHFKIRKGSKRKDITVCTKPNKGGIKNAFVILRKTAEIEFF